MVLPMVGIGAFDPVSNVTPFTYRDGNTYLDILNRLREKVEDVIAALNTLNLTNADQHNTIIITLTSQFNDALLALRIELTDLIEAANESPVVQDPTTGVLTQGLTKALSNVYDNARVFAYFAKQYDDEQLTAAQQDARNLTARHFDLGVMWPALNDVLPSP